MKNMIYIGVDAKEASCLSPWGGHIKVPNIERLAKHGTQYNKMIATAASSVMCHTTEWTGLDPEEHNKDCYAGSGGLFKRITILSTLQEQGYDVHVCLVRRCARQYLDMMPIFDGTNIHYTEMVGLTEADAQFTKKDQANKALEAIKLAKEPWFIWLLFHCTRYHDEFINYAGQKRRNTKEIKMAEEDDAIGYLMDKLDFPSSNIRWFFTADHGFQTGQNGRMYYGHHLYNNVINVPFLESPTSPAKEVSDWLQTTQISNIVLDKNVELNPKYMYAQTKYNQQQNGKYMVQKGYWKYIYDDRDKNEEFFDLESDSSEQVNLLRKIYYDPDRKKRDGMSFREALRRFDFEELDSTYFELREECKKKWPHIALPVPAIDLNSKNDYKEDWLNFSKEKK